MHRRSFLRALLLAPVAAPVALAAVRTEAAVPGEMIVGGDLIVGGEVGPDAIVLLRSEMARDRAEFSSRVIAAVRDAKKSRHLS